MRLLLGLDGMARAIVARDHQQPRGIAVEPMDDAGAQIAADGDIGIAREQSVDERAIEMAGGRVDDHAGRLVDHRDIGIFIDHGQRNILGHQVSRPRDGQPNDHTIAGTHGRAWARVVAIEPDMCIFNQLARVGA